jgi:hypothetical protein
MRRLAIFIVALTATFALLATSAEAATTSPKLTFLKGGGATVGWSTTGGSSPSDPYPNGSSILINNPAGGNAGAYTYGVSESLVGIRGLKLGQIDHLGFDSKGYLGAGAPRISLGTTGPDGDHTFFLSAYYCNDPTSGGWRTSDFVDSAQSPGTSTAGANGGCVVFDQNHVAYGPDGLTSVAAAFPDDVVVSNPNDWFLMQDEPTTLQGGSATVNVDRLTVEHWMWVRGGAKGAKNCNNPGCI